MQNKNEMQLHQIFFFLHPTVVDNLLDYPDPSFLIGDRFGAPSLLLHRNFVPLGNQVSPFPVKRRLDRRVAMCRRTQFKGKV